MPMLIALYLYSAALLYWRFCANAFTQFAYSCVLISLFRVNLVMFMTCCRVCPSAACVFVPGLIVRASSLLSKMEHLFLR